MFKDKFIIEEIINTFSNLMNYGYDTSNEENQE